MSRITGPFFLMLDAVGGGGSLCWNDPKREYRYASALHFQSFKDAAIAAQILTDFIANEVAERVEAELPLKKQGGAS